MAIFTPNDQVTFISNGTIESIRRENNNTLVTVSYREFANNRISEQTIRIVVGRNTTVLDENGNIVPASTLTEGMMINAAVSSAMTRSIPPQTGAFLVRIVNRPRENNVITGRILEVDRENGSFTVASGNNPSSVTRFNLSDDAVILDRNGRRINFGRLLPGMRVRVRHANFMTASIPPQTTAFEVRVL